MNPESPAPGVNSPVPERSRATVPWMLTMLRKRMVT